jgi:hypothetical protein
MADETTEQIKLASVAAMSKTAVANQKKSKGEQVKEPVTRKKETTTTTVVEKNVEPVPKKTTKSVTKNVPAATKNAIDKTIGLVKNKLWQTKEKSEHVEKAKYIKMIKRYYEYFPVLADELERPSCSPTFDTDIESLKEEVKRCQDFLNGQNTLVTVEKIDVFLAWAAELALINIFKQPAHGLAAEAKRSQDIVQQELKELAIIYEDWICAGPHLRYFSKCASRLEVVLNRNKRGINVSEPINEENMNNFDKKYGFK